MATLEEELLSCNRQGIALAQQGRLEEAASWFRRAVQLKPDAPAGHNNLGNILSFQGQLALAATCYRTALQLLPDDPLTLNNLGNALRQLGELDEALACCRRAVAARSGYAEAHSNLGIVLEARGELDEALFHCQTALQLKPHFPEGFNNLCMVLCSLRRFEEAIAAGREALRLRPHFAEAALNLGNALRQFGEHDDAVTWCRRAIQLKPDYAEAHSNLSIALQAREELDEALLHCQTALRLRPHFPDAYNNLCLILYGLGRFDEAIAAGQEALRLRPDHAEACHNLGSAFLQKNRYDDAAACFGRALRIRPDLAEARVGLANCLWRQDQLDEAKALCEEALRQQPKMADAQNILGAIYLNQGRFDEALVHLDQAIALQDDHAVAHFNRGLILLSRGDLAAGWREYDWRRKFKDFVSHPAQQACWDGTPLRGRSILLRAEQGRGDTLQFIRYAPLLKQRGATVTLACAAELIPLLSRCAGIDRLVSQQSALPECDTYSPLLSLPGSFGTTLATIPASIPYLFADAGLVEHWRRELAAFAGFKVGIAWQGNKKHPFDRYRSIPLAQFALLAQSGVCLLSLQKHEGLDQLGSAAGRFGVVDLGPRLDQTTGAFMDTAAVMKNLDLVITSDTAIAHLAGGLGVSVWVALSLVPDWRWLLGRQDSPWYSTMRLFRQNTRGNWEDVFARMAAELGRLVRQHLSSPKGPNKPVQGNALGMDVA